MDEKKKVYWTCCSSINKTIPPTSTQARKRWKAKYSRNISCQCKRRLTFLPSVDSYGQLRAIPIYLYPYPLSFCRVMSCTPRPAGLLVTFFSMRNFSTAPQPNIHIHLSFPVSTTFHSSSYSNLLQLGKSRGSHSYIYLRHDLLKKKWMSCTILPISTVYYCHLLFCLLCKRVRVGSSFACHPFSLHALITAYLLIALLARSEGLKTVDNGELPSARAFYLFK